MDCNEAIELLPAQVDGELGPRDALRIEQHLQGCAACRVEYAQLVAVRAAVKEHATYFTAPHDLARRIGRALPAAPVPRARRTWDWTNAGALLAAMVAVAWSLGLYLTLPTGADRLADEVVADHVRSMMSDHATDVASTDQHTVKPWFNGKVDFAPPVTDLAADGYSLVGGRLDYIAGRDTAVLVFHRRAHVINLFIWPGQAAPEPQVVHRDGYSLVRWGRGGLIYWAVSDIDTPELEGFERLFVARTGT